MRGWAKTDYNGRFEFSTIKPAPYPNRDVPAHIERHHFADARDAATFLSIVFDATACREIAPLLDHLPHFAPIIEKSKNKSQPQWIESIADLDRVNSLLSNLSKE